MHVNDRGIYSAVQRIQQREDLFQVAFESEIPPLNTASNRRQIFVCQRPAVGRVLNTARVRFVEYSEWISDLRIQCSRASLDGLYRDHVTLRLCFLLERCDPLCSQLPCMPELLDLHREQFQLLPIGRSLSERRCDVTAYTCEHITGMLLATPYRFHNGGHIRIECLELFLPQRTRLLWTTSPAFDP